MQALVLKCNIKINSLWFIYVSFRHISTDGIVGQALLPCRLLHLTVLHLHEFQTKVAFQITWRDFKRVFRATSNKMCRKILLASTVEVLICRGVELDVLKLPRSSRGLQKKTVITHSNYYIRNRSGGLLREIIGLNNLLPKFVLPALIYWACLDKCCEEQYSSKVTFIYNKIKQSVSVWINLVKCNNKISRTLNISVF